MRASEAWRTAQRVAQGSDLRRIPVEYRKVLDNETTGLSWNQLQIKRLMVSCTNRALTDEETENLMIYLTDLAEQTKELTSLKGVSGASTT